MQWHECNKQLFIYLNNFLEVLFPCENQRVTPAGLSEDQYGLLSYQVELPSKLLGVHYMFHVSQLKRCLKPPTDVVVDDTIPLEPNLTYKAYPTKILDQQDRVTRNKITRFFKVQWIDNSDDEATWKHEEFLRSNYPKILPLR
jgi:hypothetical protein